MGFSSSVVSVHLTVFKERHLSQQNRSMFSQVTQRQQAQSKFYLQRRLEYYDSQFATLVEKFHGTHLVGQKMRFILVLKRPLPDGPEDFLLRVRGFSWSRRSLTVLSDLRSLATHLQSTINMMSLSFLLCFALLT